MAATTDSLLQISLGFANNFLLHVMLFFPMNLNHMRIYVIMQ